jgi:hypothetical protein
MKRKNKDFYSLSRLLFEQEEGEEGEAEEETSEEGETEEDTSEEEETEDDADPEDLADNIDSDIEAVLIDFEAAARKSIPDNVEESLRLIYESEDDIDMDVFAGEVARLIKNYDNLIDMEKMLVDKAKDFISSRYGDDQAVDLQDKLETQHDIEVDNQAASLESDLQTPLAIGATTSGE